MLFNEPKLLKYRHPHPDADRDAVSVLFNEPKLLKYGGGQPRTQHHVGFSALQRAEIAEICVTTTQSVLLLRCGFSALQRAEIAEIRRPCNANNGRTRFSALQRAEIAEMASCSRLPSRISRVSVLFNEPKLLKSASTTSQ